MHCNVEGVKEQVKLKECTEFENSQRLQEYNCNYCRSTIEMILEVQIKLLRE